MASISSLSLNTGTTLSSGKRMSGLMSGLDTDQLVYQMTTGTRNKISKQKQQKQLLQWKMDAYRGVSDKLVDFSKKYTSYSSPSTNIYSSNFFSKNIITAKGANAGAVTVSGSGANAGKVSIAGVKQLASNASGMSSTNVSDQTMVSDAIDIDGTIDISALAGKSIKIAFGKTQYGTGQHAVGYDIEYSFSFDSTKFESMDDVAEYLNGMIDKTTGISQENFKFEAQDGKLALVRGEKGTSNQLVIKSGTALDTLGLTKGASVGYTEGGTYVGGTPKSLIAQKDTKEVLDGAKFNLTYNGVSKTITLPSKDEIGDVDDLVSIIQQQVDKEFGENRIEVKNDGGKLSLRATKTDGSTDSSSVIKFTSSNSEVASALGFKSGASNRLNMGTSLKDYLSQGELDTLFTSDGKLKAGALVVNGVDLVDSEITSKSTLAEVVKAINNSDAKVNISYLETADKFTVTSTMSGESGKIDIGGSLGDKVFGTLDITKGKDAMIEVDYGNGVTTTLTRDSNTFDLEGMSITLNKAFGYEPRLDADGNEVTDADGNVIMDKVQDTEAISFEASADVDKITEAVKTMVEDYNAMIEHINDQLTAKRDRDYQPLTDEQKEDMTEDQIKQWEEKAQEGILSNDTDLRSLQSDLRFIFSGNGNMTTKLKEWGIEFSSDWKDNGKINFDESKFKAALAGDDLEEIKNYFTEPKKSETKNGITTTTQGSMLKMKDVLDKYAATTGARKGILIEKAGSKGSPGSILKNKLQEQIDDIDSTIKNLLTYLQKEEDRYYSKFAALEQATAQANSQSSYFMSMMGGGSY